jgi:hypothetical protein
MIIPTHSGKLLNILNPKEEDICIEDIAIGLSREGRFANQGKFHYSVAQHSIYCCAIVPKELKLEALLHDAAEAYLKDIPYGIKKEIRNKFKNQIDYDIIESRVMNEIIWKFKLWTIQDSIAIGINTIKEVDSRMAITESKYLYKNNDWIYKDKYSNLKSYDFPILPMTFDQVYEKFMKLYELYKRA